MAIGSSRGQLAIDIRKKRPWYSNFLSKTLPANPNGFADAPEENQVVLFNIIGEGIVDKIYLHIYGSKSPPGPYGILGTVFILDVDGGKGVITDTDYRLQDGGTVEEIVHTMFKQYNPAGCEVLVLIQQEIYFKNYVKLIGWNWNPLEDYTVVYSYRVRR